MLTSPAPAFRLALTLFAAVAMSVVLARPTRAAGPEDSVVQIFATVRLPNPLRPWARQNAVETSGTGVVIEGNRVLTSGHLVLYATEITVVGHQGGDRIDAKVASIGPGIDLATLTLDDPSFFQRHPAIPRSDKRPASNAQVAVYGFPIGGNGLAVTRGVISRTDWAGYNDLAEGLRIQIDAPINPGASGGPAVVDGAMVGLIMGQLGQAENVGYAIPNEEVRGYLDDVKDGRYDGKYNVDDSFQSLENEALRAKLGIGRSVRGMMVRKPASKAPEYALQEGDVLTKVGDVPVDNEGMVLFEEGLRLPFTSLVPRLAKEGKLPVELIRQAKPIRIDLPVSRERPALFRTFRGEQPSYFVHGPLVFSPVYQEAAALYFRLNPLSSFGSPMLKRSGDDQAFPGEELVVVTAPMMSHRLAKGYQSPFGFVLADVDGKAVKNLHHLVELLRDAQGEFLTLRFHNELAETLVFRRDAIEEATNEVMADNGIAKRGSDDVMAIWRMVPADAR